MLRPSCLSLSANSAPQRYLFLLVHLHDKLNSFHRLLRRGRSCPQNSPCESHFFFSQRLLPPPRSSPNPLPRNPCSSSPNTITPWPSSIPPHLKSPPKPPSATILTKSSPPPTARLLTSPTTVEEVPALCTRWRSWTSSRKSRLPPSTSSRSAVPPASISPPANSGSPPEPPRVSAATNP